MPSADAPETIATEEARRLYEEGLSVIPLGAPGEAPPAWFVRDRCDGDETVAREKWPKTPRVKWAEFQHRQPTEAELDNWARSWPKANWALITGRQINAVDADNAAAVAWIEGGGITRSPRKVVTAKGAHYYYQASDKVPVRNSANPYSKIDVRGYGGYVVASGSVHATGVVYTEEILPGWGDTSWHDLPILTEADLMAISAFNGERRTSNGALSFDGPGNLSFDASMVSLPADGSPVAEGGRNNALASRAGQMISAGMDARSILAAIKAENTTYSPPLPEGEVERTVVSVLQTHTRNHPDQPVPMVAPPPHVPSRLGAVNAGELVDIEPRPIDWIWDQWIGRRLTAGIFAEGGTGKSMFVLQMAVCMASGKPFIDGSILAHGRSLLVFCEDEIDRVNERLRTILERMHLTFDDIRDDVFILARIGEDSTLMTFDRQGAGKLTPFWHDLEAEIEALKPALVLIDTASDTFAGNPLDNQQVRQFIQGAYTSLALKHDLALCFLSHVSASGKASGSGTAGALAWRDRARVQIYMHRETPDDPAIQVRRMKANYAKNGVEFTAYSNGGFLQGKAGIDLSDQVNDIARMDFIALLERFEKQGNPVSPARNSPHFAPKIMARYAKSNPKTVKTKDPAKYEDAMNQLLEMDRISVSTDPRNRTKSIEITRQPSAEVRGSDL